jgi:cytoskeletal protein RodZ
LTVHDHEKLKFQANAQLKKQSKFVGTYDDESTEIPKNVPSTTSAAAKESDEDKSEDLSEGFTDKKKPTIKDKFLKIKEIADDLSTTKIPATTKAMTTSEKSTDAPTEKAEVVTTKKPAGKNASNALAAHSLLLIFVSVSLIFV